MKEIELEKIAMSDVKEKFTVRMNETITMERDAYMLYRVAKQAFEEQKSTMTVGDMSFHEYMLRTFIAGVGEKIVAGLAQMKTGHA